VCTGQVVSPPAKRHATVSCELHVGVGRVTETMFVTFDALTGKYDRHCGRIQYVVAEGYKKK